MRVDFQVQGMLDDSIFGISHVEASTPDSINENDDGGAVELSGILAEVKSAWTPGSLSFFWMIKYLSDISSVLASKAPCNIHLLAQRLSLPRLPELVQSFLYE